MKMVLTFAVTPLFALALAVLLTVGHAPPTAAQERAQVIEEILVVAPRIARERRERAGVTDLRVVERDELVDLADLDLSRTVDVRILEQRIEDAATRVCRELAEDYPFGEPSTSVCIRRAVEDTMGQVQDLVDRALAAAD